MSATEQKFREITSRPDARNLGANELRELAEIEKHDPGKYVRYFNTYFDSCKKAKDATSITEAIAAYQSVIDFFELQSQESKVTGGFKRINGTFHLYGFVRSTKLDDFIRKHFLPTIKEKVAQLIKLRETSREQNLTKFRPKKNEAKKRGSLGGKVKADKAFDKFCEWIKRNEFPIDEHKHDSQINFATAIQRFKTKDGSTYKLSPKTAARYRDIYFLRK